MHHLVTYLYLMSRAAGRESVYPLMPECCRAQEPGWVHLFEHRPVQPTLGTSA